MLDESAAGVFTIAATPFLPDGALDLDSIDTMVDFYADKGATGLTILGIMGEAGELSAKESEAVIQRVTARTDLPVVVGVSSPRIEAVERFSEIAMGHGAAGVMVAPQGTPRADDEVIAYFGDVAKRLGETSWVLQDFPLVTKIHIPAPVLRAIFDICPNCVMLKHEDWPGLEKISTLRQAEAEGARKVSILCGNGGQFLLEEMLRGVDGAMTGFAYPEMMRDVVSLCNSGDIERARDVFDAYLPLVRYECQPGLGLAARKYVLAKRGAIAHSKARKAGAELSPAAMAEIDTLIARQEARLSAL
ncbi:dihydrodipicolinate synthase family protein [Gymnodinialimonas hymeniacidonis]|uniref:dihydrodipicolinate synthase family protein n=1 Tax=Gymnodinialimonas hymeniacidonis TaxID=3126508 RepID=UPI0034C630AE